MHAVEFVKPLKVRSNGPIRHADAVRDLLVGPALGDQIDDRDLLPRERIDSACPTLVRSLRQRELRSAQLPFTGGESEYPGRVQKRSLARYRIVLLTSGASNCTFGQMPANPSRTQPSPRQRQVLDLLVQGMTNKEIGARLGISERGVKHHVTQLLVLYAVASRAELIVVVLGWKR